MDRRTLTPAWWLGTALSRLSGVLVDQVEHHGLQCWQFRLGFRLQGLAHRVHPRGDLIQFTGDGDDTGVWEKTGEKYVPRRGSTCLEARAAPPEWVASGPPGPQLGSTILTTATTSSGTGATART